MVGGVDRDQRRAALRVGHCASIVQLRVAPACVRSCGHWRAMHLDRLGEPVAVGQALARARRSGSSVQPSSAATRVLLGGDPLARGRAACGRAAALPRRHRTSSVSSWRFQPFQTPGPTARMSTTVSTSSSRSRSGLCTWPDEIVDRLGIGEVALERGRRHQQVIAHQPGDRLGLGRRSGRAAGRAQRDLGAEHAMVAAAALGDVVQQHRDIERRAATRSA